MSLAVLTLLLYFPGCSSLKEKRRLLKPLLSRLHREFNISAAEMEEQDTWQNAVISCAIISNSAKHNQQRLQKIPDWIENIFPNITVLDDKIEMI